MTSKKIAGAKGGGGGREAADTLKSESTLTAIDLLGEGQIGGLVDNSARSIFLDDTPLLNKAGQSNFEDVEWNILLGTQDQNSLTGGFDTIESPSNLGVEVTQERPVTFTIDDPNAEAVKLIMSVPSLMKTDDKGNINGTSVTFKASVSVNNGAYSEIDSDTINGKSRSNYQKLYTYILPVTDLRGEPAVSWSFRIERVTPDSKDTKTQNQLYVQSYSSVITTNLRYPNSAIVGIQVNAKQFQSIPRRSYLVDGLLIRVPNNRIDYGHAVGYEGTWNGGFKLAVCDNPAWILYDVLSNPRYGLGQYIPKEFLNEGRLYQIGQYCDELVDDGYGNKERRFSINTVISSLADAYQLIGDITSVFNGMAYWTGNSLGYMCDMPTPTSMIYNASNVVNGEFSYQGVSRKERHSVALVRYNDPERNYEMQTEYIEDSEMIKRFGVRKIEVTAFGCTTRGQANRVGKWLLYTEKYQKALISFNVGIDSALVTPGDVIEIVDPHRAGKRFGGRLIDCTATSATLDDQININIAPENEPKIYIRLANGLVVDRGITTINVVNGKSIVGWQAPLPTDNMPLPNAIWNVKTKDLQPLTARVVGISQTENPGEFNITAVEHHPSKYGHIEQNLVLETPNLTVVDIDSIRQPASARIVGEKRIDEQGITSYIMNINWEQVPEATSYIVQYRKENGNWVELPPTKGLSVDIDNVFAGKYEATVQAVSPTGYKSNPTIAVLTNIDGSAAVLPKISNIKTNSLENAIEIVLGYTSGTIGAKTVVIEQCLNIDVPDDQKEWGLLTNLAYPTDKYTVQGIDNENPRMFRAKLIDAFGVEGEWSDPVIGMATINIQKQLDEAFAEAQKTAVRIDEMTTQAVEEARQVRQLIGAESEARNIALDNLDAKVTKEISDRATAIVAESKARADALAQEATNRTNAINAKATEINTRIDSEVAQLNDGITQEIVNRKQGDSDITGELNAYKRTTEEGMTSALTQIQTVSNANALTSERVDALVSRMDTVEGDVATKASGQALNDLKNTVTQQGNTISSQGQSITSLNNNLTALKNTVNTKADSSALNALTNRVTQTEQGINTASQNITSLSGRLDTAENTLGTKASNSALQTLQQQVDQQGRDITTSANQVTSLTSRLNNLSIGARNLITSAHTVVAYNNEVMPASVVKHNTEKYFGQPVYVSTHRPTNDSVRDGYRTVKYNHGIYLLNNPYKFVPNTPVVVSVYWKAISHSDTTVGLTASNIGGWQDLGTIDVGNGWKRSWAIRRGTTSGRDDCLFFSFTVPSVETNQDVVIWWACPQLEIGEVLTDWTPAPEDIDAQINTKASADAVEQLTTNVNRINDTVTAESTKLSSLKTDVDGKFSNVDSRLATISNNVTTVASKTDTLESKVGGAGVIKTYTIKSYGLNHTSMNLGGIYNSKGVRVYGNARSYVLVVFNSDGDIASTTGYDIYGSTDARNNFITAVANLAIGTYVAVYTYDEPRGGLEAIRDSLINLGASRLTLDQMVSRGAYILIGRKGYSEGNGIELIQTAADGTASGLEYSLQMIDGVPSNLSGATIASFVKNNYYTKAEADQVVASKSEQLSATLQQTMDGKIEAAKDLKETIIDLRSLDPDTYYAVYFSLPSNRRSYINIEQSLGDFSSYNPRPAWTSHGAGFSLNLKWSVIGSGWGSSAIDRVIDNFWYAWTVNNISPVMLIDQAGAPSIEYVYLRGGVQYRFRHSSYLVLKVSTDSNDVWIWVDGKTKFALPPKPLSEYNANNVPKPTLQSQITANANYINNVNATVNNNTARVSALEAFRAKVGEVSADITNQYTTLANATSSLATKVTTVESKLTSNSNLFLNSGFNDTENKLKYWERNDAATISPNTFGTGGTNGVLVSFTNSGSFRGVAQELLQDDYAYSNKPIRIRFLTSSTINFDGAVGVHYKNSSNTMITQHWANFSHTTGYTNVQQVELPAVNGATRLRVMITAKSDMPNDASFAVLQPSLSTDGSPITAWFPNSRDGINSATALSTVTDQITTDTKTIDGKINTYASAIRGMVSSVGGITLSTEPDTSKQNQWSRVVVQLPAYTAEVGYKYLTECAYVANSAGFVADRAGATNTWDGVALYFRTIVTVDQDKIINLGNLTGDDAWGIFLDGVYVDGLTNYGSKSVSFNIKAGTHIIDVIANEAGGGEGFSYTNALAPQVTSMYAAKLPDLPPAGVKPKFAKIDEVASVVNGDTAFKMVKINNNGVISGYGLSSTLSNGAVESTFKIDATRFMVTDGSGNGQVPFYVQGGKTYINEAMISQLTAENIVANTLKAKAITTWQYSNGTGARTVISGSKIEVYDSSGRLRVRLGLW